VYAWIHDGRVVEHYTELLGTAAETVAHTCSYRTEEILPSGKKEDINFWSQSDWGTVKASSIGIVISAIYGGNQH
jgi:hypothetical protein